MIPRSFPLAIIPSMVLFVGFVAFVAIDAIPNISQMSIVVSILVGRLM
jgi:hypothetical protein